MAAPTGIAVDRRGGQTRLYVADTGNHRVLGWADTQSYQAGDPPAVVLGQPAPDGSAAMGTGPTGFNSPAAVAVDPLTGNLYVADTGNHRVLRFQDPFRDVSRVEPNAVYGQPDFNTRTANGSGNAQNGLNSPGGVAVDTGGNLWIADTGNHRVLRYPAGVLDLPSPSADVVVGQRDLTQTGRNRSGTTVSPGGFASPLSVAFDAGGNLYVSDSANSRVLRFGPPFQSQSTASAVIDMPAVAQPTAVPAGLAVFDTKLYVALPREHRVLVFSIATNATADPISVLGQPDLTSREANAGVGARAASYSLMEAGDVDVDSNGAVYIADTGNNRVLRFSGGSRSADQVWGQLDLSSNGPNQVKASGVNVPYKVVIDYSREPYALYASDTRNHRVLIWKDSARFRTGDPADAVIGQPDLRTGIANFDASRHPTATSLSSPKGIAVDDSGNLYVADSGNHRVLRYARPVDQPGIIAAEFVIGQSDFSGGAAGGVSRNSLRSPSSVAIGPDGNIFVADTGNNRVLEFSIVGSSNPAAIRVYGQPNFTSATGPRSVSPQTLSQPSGIVVDQGFTLYVADTGANRILVFPNTRDMAPSSNSASLVIGSDRFDTVQTGPGPNRLNTPLDISIDSAGRIYVADTRNNRVLVFPSLIFLPISDAAATSVIGQADAGASAVNWSSQDGTATADGLFEPAGLFVDRRDTLYVADSGNHRVLHFLKAARVLHAAYRQASTLGRGALVNIEGEGLAQMEQTSVTPARESVAEREVVIDDSVRAPLLSVSPIAVSFQLPATSPMGSSRIALRAAETSELIAGAAVAIAAYAPGLFTRVLNQDGTTNSDTNPAAKGSVIRITGTGQGPVSPSIADGEAAPEGAIKTVAVPTSDGNACLTRQPSVCVALGNTFGDVRFSGLAAGMIGVWQLDVSIPATASSGVVPVRAVINAVPSNIVQVYIR